MTWGWLELWSKVQLVPAIAAGSVVVLLGLALSVALFGRLYCSVVCPLGILQWLFRFVLTGCGFRRKSLPRPLAVSPRTLWTIRLFFLLLFVVSASFGLIAWLAPFGIFGRTVLAFFGQGRGLEGFPPVVKILIGAQIAFILLMTLWRSRFWCNTVCPVGTVLGLFSRFAFFRVRIDAAKCVGCNECARACQNGCISSGADKKIDYSRCVTCFGCARACRKGALTWR